jgi:hypothetical protein
MNRITIMVFVLISPTSAFAAGNTPLATGLGMTTCEQFMRSIQASPKTEDVYFEWAQGYMAGMNAMFGPARFQPKDLTAMKFPAQKAVIRDFCKTHPLEDYETAVPAVYALLPAAKKLQ